MPRVARSSGPLPMTLDQRPNNRILTSLLRPLVEDGFRCIPVSGFSAASVSNADEMPPYERQLYGTSTVKIFPLPGS